MAKAKKYILAFTAHELKMLGEILEHIEGEEGFKSNIAAMKRMFRRHKPKKKKE